MMGPRQEAQGALFYEFSLEDHVPAEHLLRSIDRFVDLSGEAARSDLRSIMGSGTSQYSGPLLLARAGVDDQRNLTFAARPRPANPLPRRVHPLCNIERDIHPTMRRRQCRPLDSQCPPSGHDPDFQGQGPGFR